MKKVVFRTKWFFVEEEFFDNVPALNGEPIYRIVEPEGIGILAMTKEQKIILIHQFRPAVKEHTLELPAGHIDDGEDALTCAERELYEETGYNCDKLFKLASNVLLQASRSTIRVTLFLGLDAVLDPLFTPKENIKVTLATLGEFKRLILNGECRQCFAAGVLQLASWAGLIPEY